MLAFGDSPVAAIVAVDDFYLRFGRGIHRGQDFLNLEDARLHLQIPVVRQRFLVKLPGLTEVVALIFDLGIGSVGLSESLVVLQFPIDFDTLLRYLSATK